MTRNRLFVWAGLLLLAALVAFIPLRVAVADQALVARKVEGVIWDGSIRDLQVGNVVAGDVNARLHFWPLLLGRTTISLSRGAAPFAPGLRGSFTNRIGGTSIDNLNATLAVGALLAPLPAENVDLQDFSAHFASGRCVEAGGTVRLTVGSALPGFDIAHGLLGQPRCDDGLLLIPLQSQSAMEHLDIRISGDRTYTATILLEGDRAEQAAALGLAGFRPVAGGYRLLRKGRF